MVKKPSIVCFGEVLWDVLPTGKVAGGAPMNVAYQSKSLGCEVQMISAIGNDDLGKELIAFLNKKGIPINLIQTNYTFPTSTVQVTLNEKGSASYEIVKPVAWDFIYPDEERISAVEQADVLLFGSLVCRDEYSRNTLFGLIEKAQKTVFDVNLRPPHYELNTLKTLMQQADFIKFNDDEIFELSAAISGKKLSLEESILFFAQETKTSNICVTMGADGAVLFKDNEFVYNKGYKIKVTDTVGAGDSFLATLIYQLLMNASAHTALNNACAIGAIVASKEGANPIINDKEIQEIMQKN